MRTGAAFVAIRHAIDGAAGECLATNRGLLRLIQSVPFFAVPVVQGARTLLGDGAEASVELGADRVTLIVGGTL